MPFSSADAFLYLAIAFVLIEAIWDRFRSVEIPLMLLLTPFGIAAVSLFLNGQYLVLIISIALVLFDLIPNTIIRRLTVVLCIILLGLLRWDIGLFILLVWLFYEFNILGGADALACFSLLLIRPDIALAFWLLVGMGVGAWVIGIRRHGLSFFKKSAQAMLGLAKAPVSEKQLLEEGSPFLWPVFLGSLMYVLIFVFILNGGWLAA